MQSEKEKLWTYDRFEVGKVFSTIDLVMDEDRRSKWVNVFGATSDRLPRGMMMTAMMEAYILAIQPRPDGNVHASQELKFTGEAAQWGDRLSITVMIADKEIRKERNWVRFGVTAKVGRNTVMTGTIRSIWAA